MSLPSFRGTVAPSQRPEGKAVRCTWGACEAGGWIMEKTPRVTNDSGSTYHHGCHAAMTFANQKKD